MNRHQQIIIFLALLLQFLAPSVSDLFRVDDKLMLRFTYNRYVLVFFAKSTECQECEYFTEVITAESDLFQAQLTFYSLAVYDSNLTHLYSPYGAPAVVFFRSGIPMLLDMDMTWDQGDLYIRCFWNRDVRPMVELTDDAFDRITNTTDDWFIYFHNQSCVECKALDSMWEGLAGEQNIDRGYITKVGKVNTSSDGKMIAKRFGIEKIPQFIFIKKGVYYVYNGSEDERYKIKSFLEFAKSDHKYSEHHDIPPPPLMHEPSPVEPFHEKFLGGCLYLVSEIKIICHEHPYVLGLIFYVGATLVCVVSNFWEANAKQNQKKEENTNDDEQK